MSYTPENGDLYIIEDRKQLGFSQDGANYSIQPNGWYIAGQPITKGFAVSIGNATYSASVGTGSAGNVYLTQEGITEKTIGIALNSATTGQIVETVDRGVFQWPTYLTVTVSGSTANSFIVNDGVNTVTYTPAVTTTATALVDNIITAYNLNPRPNVILSRLNSTTNVVAMSWISVGVPGIGTPPVFISSITNATVTASTVFSSGDFGNTAYISPTASPALPASQFTTDRNTAVATGNAPIELGIVIDANTVWIDFEGDSRGGVSNVSQVSGTTNEILTIVQNTGVSQPMVVSLGTDNKIYMSDKAKSYQASAPTLNRTQPMGFITGGTGFSSGSVASGVSVVIQKMGLISGFVGLTPGLPVYLSTSGTYTQNVSSFNTYTDVVYPLGVAFSTTAMFINLGYASQTADTNEIGTIVAMKNATPDSWYLKCNGDVLNALTTTTLGSGANIGTWNGTALFNKIGTTFGGALVYTVAGTAPGTGLTFYVNGTLITTTGTTATQIATQIVTQLNTTQTGYNYTSGGAGIINVAVTTAYSNPVFVFGTLTGVTITLTSGTFNLPNVATTPSMQIKYSGWGNNTAVTPMYRLDTDWTAYPNVPTIASGSTGSMASGGTINIPLTAFGASPQLYDIVAEIYAKNNSGVQRKLSTGIAISGANRYGVTLSLTTANTLTLNFGANGLAFSDSTGTWTALDNTYTYRIVIYKAERFNKFYDYTSDLWLTQFKSLGLVDYTISTATAGAGRFDLGATNPSGAGTRLNFSGAYWASTLNASGAITSMGNALVLFSNAHNGLVQSDVITADRTWTLPDASGKVLVASPTALDGYFDFGVVAPLATTTGRVNFGGTIYAKNFVATTGSITSTTGDLTLTSGNLNASGMIVTGDSVTGGILGRGAHTSRPVGTLTNRNTFGGKLVASHLEANTLTGEVSNSLNANGNFDMDDQNGVTPVGWAIYADSSNSGVPTLGSTTTPNGDFTFVTVNNAGGSISGVYSAQISKSATNRQGHGVNTTITLPAVLRRNKWIKLSFDYRAVSGTYADGDVQVYLAVTGTNTNLVPLQNIVPNSTTATSFKTYILTDGTHDSYQLCFHVATATTNNFVLELSKVSIGFPEVSSHTGTSLVGVVTPANATWAPYLVFDSSLATMPGTLTTGGAYFQFSGHSSYFGGKVRIGSLDDTDSYKFGVTGTGHFTGLLTTDAGIASSDNLSTTKQLVSSMATGTPPLVITSTSKVTNLNVDQVDGADLDTDGVLTSNSDVKIPSQKAVKTYVDTNAGSATTSNSTLVRRDGVGNIAGKQMLLSETTFAPMTVASSVMVSGLNVEQLNGSTKDTATDLSGNSDSKISTQKAVKAYVDGNVSTLNSTITSAILGRAYGVVRYLTTVDSAISVQFLGTPAGTKIYFVIIGGGGGGGNGNNGTNGLWGGDTYITTNAGTEIVRAPGGAGGPTNGLSRAQGFSVVSTSATILKDYGGIYGSLGQYIPGPATVNTVPPVLPPADTISWFPIVAGMVAGGGGKGSTERGRDYGGGGATGEVAIGYFNTDSINSTYKFYVGAGGVKGGSAGNDGTNGGQGSVYLYY